MARRRRMGVWGVAPEKEARRRRMRHMNNYRQCRATITNDKSNCGHGKRNQTCLRCKKYELRVQEIYLVQHRAAITVHSIHRAPVASFMRVKHSSPFACDGLPCPQFDLSCVSFNNYFQNTVTVVRSWTENK